MLKIVEINSEEQFENFRAKEQPKNDYLYICKHSSLIKLSDNGELKTFGDMAGADFLSSEGFGNLRFTNNKFQYYNTETETWVDTQVTQDNSCIVSLTPQPMQTFVAQCNPDTLRIELTIKEPNDTIVDQQAFVIIERVIIRRKKGEIPIDENDGDLVLEISRKNFGAYKNVPYIDTVDNVTNGEVYYYKAFPISNIGIVSNSNINESKCVIRDYYLYGFKIDQTESDPASMITYIEDNKNYKSAYMNYATNSFYYGDWEKVWFIKNLKPCMLNYDGTVAYELNPNDYSKKIDGTESDIGNKNFEGNVMIGIPKVYWKVVDNGDNTANIYFSNKKIDDDFHCWSHIDANGNEIDYCYMSVYNGYYDGTRIRSLSGYTPTNNIKMSNRMPLVSNNLSNSAIWQLEVFSDYQLINLLLLLIGKSTDSQTVFGNGYSPGTGNYSNPRYMTSGSMDDKGLFYGTNANNTTGVKVFGIEHRWGNGWRFIAGHVYDKLIHKIKLTYGQYDGSTVDGYNTTGEGYVSLFKGINLGTSASYTSKMNFGYYGLIPNGSGGSSSTYYPDMIAATTFSGANEIPVAISGGDTGGGSAGTASGMFIYCLDFCDVDSASWNSINNISCKPNKE